jgi:hypothetical protein
MKTDEYRKKLRTLKNWDSFLLKESGLPGPRGNLELVQAVADEGNRELFERLVTVGPEQAPTNSPGEFLAVCGVVGLGRLVAQGEKKHLRTLRQSASDPRWRVREGVAMALQRVGDANMPLLLKEAEQWSRGNLLEKRAAAAALCEPRLLKDPKNAKKVLVILDAITASIPALEERKSDEFTALKKGLGYCWSVAAAALPIEGKAMMEKWFVSRDRDVRWIMKENLRKDRLVRMDARWVERWRTKLVT